MSTPVLIRDIRLDRIAESSEYNLVQGENYYFIFWWKGIPFHDCFLDDYSGKNNEIFSLAVSRVKEDLLRSGSVSETTLPDYEPIFSDTPAFTSLMDRIYCEGGVENISFNRNKLTVVVCTRNRPSQLENCIISLKYQKKPPAEIIIVDNGSADNTAKKIAEKFNVRYEYESRVGLDIARNTGARSARFEIVAYVDDDVTVHQNWCEQILESFEDAEICAVAGLVMASELQTESQQIFEKFWTFNKGYRRKIFDKEFLKEEAPRVWEIGAGANMAFRKDLLSSLNYFDERLDAGAAGCSGDSEMWYRILVNEKKILYNPKAIVHHTHRPDIESLKKQLFYYMRGHTAAALIQDSYKSSGYRKYIYYTLPKYYLILLKSGFPAYNSRYSTLWSEFKGIVSGILFYWKFKKVKTF